MLTGRDRTLNFQIKKLNRMTSHKNISKKMEREGDIAKLLQTEFDLSSEKP